MLLAIDQGTTGTTCIVFDLQGEEIGRAYMEFRQHFPFPGWVEHDPREILNVTLAVAQEALADAGVEAAELEAIGITNQRETVVAWDPATGEPLHNAIVWQDRRTSDRCEELRAEGYEDMFRAKTGLVLDPYFSATKIEWLLRNVDGLADKARSGRALFGTIDSWLIWNLTGGDHLTDVSNASRTALFNLKANAWDEELLALFDVPKQALPEIRPSCGDFGRTSPDRFFGASVLISGVAGDQQAALFGQGCLVPGMGKNTYGTGSFLLVNAGTKLPEAARGLLTTTAWQIGGSVTYALEAAIFVTGAAIQWLRDSLGIIANAAESETLAASLSSNDGVYFVPALTGLGSPHWDPYARGTIIGLTRGSGRAHLARAALEAIAFQTCDAVGAMNAATGEPLHELRADGGATANSWLMQFQADMLGVPVIVPEVSESTAFGAALLAGVGVNVLTLDQVMRLGAEKARYEPTMSEDQRGTLLAEWSCALECARSRDQVEA